MHAVNNRTDVACAAVLAADCALANGVVWVVEGLDQKILIQ